ncbi:hypothetical protein COCNU_04G003560 [Cocos nucifera]|uniref:Uncharacterized protein n=1 Tax=Cocos nucifera TaxID=13894 RepID=A0A8K0I4Y6_COCNU|nr:hypothetical protein COCNU_04G003560 [Cocos nucifera]
METRSTRGKPLEQLNLHAPLKSTRRSSSSVDTISMSHSNSVRVSSTEASQRVPFVWESSPGVPKDAGRTGLSSNRDQGPVPPKPPPNQWRPLGEDHSNNANGRHRSHGTDDGNDGDIDMCSDGTEDGDVFSDALEKISLSESLAITRRLSSCHTEPMVNRAPSFIMNRFLPAASALANSSAISSTTHKHWSRRAPPSCSHPSQKELTKMRTRHRMHDARLQVPYFPHGEDRTDVPSKACGLMLFFPWSLKPMVCGFKSPGRCRTPRANLSVAPRKTIQGSSDGPSSEVEDDGGGYEDKLSIKACHSPGWGLPFLQTSRLIKGGRNGDKGKAKAFRVPGELESRCGRSQNRADGGGGVRERKSAVWSLPQLRSPSESWLSNNVLDTMKK